jgi:hypothetical protein
MSQENVEIVRQGHETFNLRDLEAYLALHDPDEEFTPTSGRSRALARIADMMAFAGGGTSHSRPCRISELSCTRYVTSAI